MKSTWFFLGALLTLFTFTACTPTLQTRVVHEYKPKSEPVAQPWFRQGEKGVHLIANNPVSAVLMVNGEKIRVSGRSSMHLSTSESSLKESKLMVKGFNLVFFDVPQQSLAKGMEIKQANGVLGFAVSPEAPQLLSYDARGGKVTGELKGYVAADYMSKLIKGPVKDGKGDLFETFTQPASLKLDFMLKAPITLDEKAEVDVSKGELGFSLKADQAEYEKIAVSAFELSTLERYAFEYEVMHWWYYEAGKSLCVQPVRIARLKRIKSRVWPWDPMQITVEYTGDGLAFGQPQASSLWAKADVVFSYRDWKTLWKSDYWVVSTKADMTTSTEQSNLMAEVNDADCIEVFFVDEFDPVDWGGGGATWGLGIATSKIITTDANADGGVDLTHLAHELGHVLNLMHPNDAGSNASTGTLMCPSGYLNDNPDANSQENKDNISNPLLTFTFKLKTTGPDCEDSADCGSCP